MRNRKMTVRVVLFVIFFLLLLANAVAFFDSAPEFKGPLGVFLLLSLLALIMEIANKTNDFVDIIMSSLDSVLGGRKPYLQKLEVRNELLKFQRLQWIQSVLERVIDDKPIDVPFDIDGELSARGQNSLPTPRDENVGADDTSTSGKARGPLDFFTKFFPRLSGKAAMPEKESDSLKEEKKKSIPLLDIFRNGGRQLIILGEGGSGKTFALIQLLRALHDEASSKQSAKIPIIFDLASWGLNPMPLNAWFLRELADLFPDEPPMQHLRSMVNSGELIYLIDGFDELPDPVRPQLYHELMAFTHFADVSVDPICFVLCSRPEEFNAVHDTNIIMRTITLQKVERGEIERYLADESYQQIRNFVLEPGSLLYEAARRPFVLNALATAYKSMRPQDIHELRRVLEQREGMVGEPDLEPIPRLILQRYIDQQSKNVPISLTKHEGHEKRYRSNRDDILTWIAIKLQETVSQGRVAKGEVNRTNTSIVVSYLQPSWLDNQMWRWFYSLLSRMMGTLAIMFAVGFFLASPLDYLAAGLVCGATLGVLHALTSYTPLSQWDEHFPKGIAIALRLVVVYVVGSLVLSVWLGLTTATSQQDRIVLGRLALVGITLAWFFNLFVAIIYTTRNIRIQIREDIRPVEKLRPFLRAFFAFGMIGGVAAGLLVGVFAQGLALHQSGSTMLWLREVEILGRHVPPFAVGGGVGFFFGTVIVGLFGFLSISDVNEGLRPNHEIWASIRNAVSVALAFAVLFSLLFGGGFWWYYQDTDALYRGIRNGLAIGLLAGLWYGGIDTIHHGTLRFMLYASGRTPFRLAEFLHYCSELNIMREIGSRVVFNHTYIRLFYLSRPRPSFRWRKQAVAGLLAFFLLLMVSGSAGYFFYDSIFSFDTENQVIVTGLAGAHNTPPPPSTCVEAGQTVTIESRGMIRTGDFMGYITSEGSEVGLFGLPAGDAYDVVPKLPNNALICKLDNEGTSAWRRCAERTPQSVFFWSTRTMSFTAPHRGCLIFDINEIEDEKRTGHYYVKVSTTP